MNNSVRKVVILGSGCAGHTAALYAARANLRPLVLRGEEYGGQLALTATVENFPGWPDGIGGMSITDNMEKQAQGFGAEYWADTVAVADLNLRPFTLSLEGGGTVRAETLIIATGASVRWLGLPSEQALRKVGGGASSCAVCDGRLHTGKEVCVIGGVSRAAEN